MFKRIITNLKLLNTKRPENKAFENKIVEKNTSLSVKDIEFIKGWSISSFGMGGIFYMFLRNLYEPLGLLAIVSYIGNYIEKKWPDILYNTDTEPWLRVSILIVTILLIVAWIYGVYFLLRHGRRLSWNRCQWDSVEELKRSEKKWFWWNFVGSLALLAVLYSM